MTGMWRFVVVCLILALPGVGQAQEAALTGRVTDTTGGALPGVTVSATNEQNGNLFTGVTDGRGTYTISVRVGRYRISTELPGFATVARSGVQVLVGQTVQVDFQMEPTGVEETVTVTGEAPLVNTTTSTLAGNVDPRQVQELPVSGRNFMALALLAPGSRTQSMDAQQPLEDRGRSSDVREFHINLDGQQVTRDLGTGGQPKYSQDMIAEFQYIANRFDATRGRSSGVLLNIISKSGTNQHSGVFRTNFRDSRFNAKHPIFNRVLPISNQQYSTALGGPVLLNRLHYFGNFEYERQPSTSVWNTPYPEFNVTLQGNGNAKKGSGRLDYQLSPEVRVMGRVGKTTTFYPFGPGGTNHPAGTSRGGDYNEEFFMRYTHVLSNRAVNELEGGRAVYGFHEEPLTSWSNHWQAFNGVTVGSPRIRFRDFDITPNRNLPRRQDQWVWSLRNNLTLSYEARGRHDIKAGAEFLRRDQLQFNRRNSGGEIDARGGPTPANLAALFPDPWNVDTWNLAAISSITRSYIVGVGNFENRIDSSKLGAWIQDDWQISRTLTLNLGLRWDVMIDAMANDVNFPPWQVPGRPNDWYDLQPRLGFAYKVGERAVLRGGVGLYYADAGSGGETQSTGNTIISVVRYTNNNLPNFAVDPTNGRGLPTYEEAQQQFCHANNFAPGCIFQDADDVTGPYEYTRSPRTWQSSIGLQRQFGQNVGMELDYVHTRGSREPGVVDNANLTYNPATGANYPFSDVSRRAFPGWGRVSMRVHTGRSKSHELRTTFTKRYSNRWQGMITYTLAGFWDAEPPPMSGLEPVPFATAPDLGGEFSLAAHDQRHRAVLSGIWEVGLGIQVSALHFFGAGIRLASTYGGDLRNLGIEGTSRLRPDGTIVPRNSLTGPAQNRTDLRLQRRFQINRISIDAIAEGFNIFNRPNWRIGTQENRSDYLKRINGEYRTAQFGLRLSF